MSDIQTLINLASDRTPYTDLDWRKAALKKIEIPAARPFIKQALAYMKEMEAGIRSASPLFTADHAREARSNIRAALGKAVQSLETIEVSDKLMDEISEGAKQIDGSQVRGFKIYKGVPVTVTNLWGTELDKLKQLLSNTDIQGYPVFLRQTLVGINVKAATKQLKNVVSPKERDTAHHLDYFDTTERDKNVLQFAHKYRALTESNWEIVSGEVFWKNGVGYLWIASTPKLAERIGIVVSGKNREWSVASFASVPKEVKNVRVFGTELLIDIFDKAKRMKKSPHSRINYEQLATRFKLPVDVIRGILDGKIQPEDTARLAADLRRWRI